MTNEIPKHNWQLFLDDLTKRRFEWQTKVEVLKDEIGNQVLDEGLPFRGMTCETKNEETFIEVFVGSDDDHHQTHTIRNPTSLAYFSEDDKPSGVVEVKEADGTNTLVHLIEPMPIVVQHIGANDIATT